MAHGRRAVGKSHTPRLRVGLGPRLARAAASHAKPLLRRPDASRRRKHCRAPLGRCETVAARKVERLRSDRGSVFPVVVATPDVVGERMAGPGIRAWHLAEELRKHFPTTLIAHGDWKTAEARYAMNDAAVLIGQPVRGFRRRRPDQRIVLDLFDP